MRYRTPEQELEEAKLQYFMYRMGYKSRPYAKKMLKMYSGWANQLEEENKKKK